MANRREILQAGLAASALSVTGFGARPVGARGAPLQLECFVCDRRFVDSITAARAARRHGFDVHLTSGDMTELWYHRLDALWRGRPAAIAGVTGDDALFVLERLGWDRGLRVVYRGEHMAGEVAGEGAVRHRLDGAENLVEALAERGALSWPERFAQALAACGSDVSAARRARFDGCTARRSNDGPAPISWLIAATPAARARAWPLRPVA